jgi:hypothetical protein
LPSRDSHAEIVANKKRIAIPLLIPVCKWMIFQVVELAVSGELIIEGLPRQEYPMMLQVPNPLIALGVVASTAATDAVYVMFTAAGSWLGAFGAVSWLGRGAAGSLGKPGGGAV